MLPDTFVAGFHDPDVVGRMSYRRFGDRLVSSLSLGASALAGVFRGVDEAECLDVVELALRSGINVIDTAPWYGHGLSEEVLGRALKRIPRGAYYLHTKVGRYQPAPLETFDFSYERTIQSVDESLARLQLEFLDCVQGACALCDASILVAKSVASFGCCGLFISAAALRNLFSTANAGIQTSRRGLPLAVASTFDTIPRSRTHPASLPTCSARSRVCAQPRRHPVRDAARA